MLKLEINVEVAAASLEAAAAALADPAALRDAAANGVEDGVRVHLQDLNRRSPNTNFYMQAAASVQRADEGTAAVLMVTHRGTGLRLRGGTVTAGASVSSHTGAATRALAIPTDDVPVKDGRRLAPREAGLLAWIPNRHGNIHTSGFLVEGVEKEIKRGKNKGKKRIVPKEGGKLLYVLRRLTVHTPDPTVLPSDEEMARLAREGAADYVASFE